MLAPLVGTARRRCSATVVVANRRCVSGGNRAVPEYDDGDEQPPRFGATLPFTLQKLKRLRTYVRAKKFGVGESAFWSVVLRQNSKAHQQYIEICREYDNLADCEKPVPDPLVQLVPPTKLDGIIPHAMYFEPILKEAGAIVTAYSKIHPSDANGGKVVPDIAPPALLPNSGIPFLQSSISAGTMIDAICKGHGTRTIKRMQPGCVLCGIIYTYVSTCLCARRSL